MDSHLNPQQLAAVTHGSGPLLIIAGAGTGKTTVIVERIKWLIAGGLAQPGEILGLTFTEKASLEMQTRLDEVMPLGYTRMWIMTFHGFCESLLREHALDIGLDPQFKVLTQIGSVALLKKHFFEFDLDYYRPLGNPHKFLYAITTFFSRLCDEDVSPLEFNTWAKGQEEQKYQELAKLRLQFQKMKEEKGVLDFGDLISYTLLLLEKRPRILDSYRQKFKYILVDEFQDTNFAQIKLIKLLLNKQENVSVVADDDQCLPAGTKISTPVGLKNIENIKKGETVITAVGKGYLSSSTVNRVMKNSKFSKFVTFTTDTGKIIKTTSNHKMFCMIPGKKYGSEYYYVYLMQRLNLGWRLGITNDLSTRLKLERSADRIIAIKSCNSDQEARYYETVFSLKYGIPLYPFKPRKRMVLTGKWLDKLFFEIDTNKNVVKLAQDLGVDLNSHHFCLGAVVRGSLERTKVVLRMCVRKNRTKWAKNRLLDSPKVVHEVRLETSSMKTISKLEKAHITFIKAKKGWVVKKQFTDLVQAGEFAQEIVRVTDSIFESKFDIAKRNGISRQALIMPAANILPGMRIPVQNNYEVVYEQVIKRVDTIGQEVVYDLEIAKTHNYIANGVVVHNSIYQWRGAATGNVVAFQKSFPKIKLVTLNQNYRSTQTILDHAHQLISFNNPDRLEIAAGIDKKLISQNKKSGPVIEVLSAPTASVEAELVVQKIRDLLTNYEPTNQLTYKDFAILVRANNHAELFIKSLENLGIPAQFLGPGKLFLQPEIKDLLALLRLINDPSDNAACYRVLKMSYWQIPGITLTQILTGSPTSSVLKTAQESKNKTVANLIHLYQHALENIHIKSPGETLYAFLEESGMLKDMLDYKLPISETQAKNISKFFNKIKQFETENPDTTLGGLLEWIDLSLELGESPAAVLDSDWSLNDAVNILTIHSAKGLEFPVVFMVNLVTGRFPSLNRKDPIEVPPELVKEISPQGDSHIQEERRLFYVGMTRAKNRLFFSLAQSYGEGIREKKPSPFLAEALGVHSSEFIVHGETQKIIPSPKKLSMNHELTNQLTINYITYSQIQTFLDCPLHYKAKYILHLPTPPSAASSFGNAIHATLNTFFKDSQQDILKIFKNKWKKEGFENKKHEELYFQKGEQYLTKFISQNPPPYPNTIKLEESFKFFLGDLTVSGKIDRVDILPDGKIEIIDYKTSPKMLSPKEAVTDLQLSIYALAATKLSEKPFSKNPEDIVLSLYYLDTQTKVTTTRTQEQLDDAEKQILDYVSQIESSDFKCSGSFICQKCDFKILCDPTKLTNNL